MKVKKSGYFNYDESFGDDHRVVWGTLSEETIIGQKVGNIKQKSKMKLKTDNPRHIKNMKHNQILNK